VGHTVLAAALVVAFASALWALDRRTFWHGDVQLQHLPVSRDVARALSEGSFPLLSPYSWNAGALAGEYQYGIFSPVQLLLDYVVWRFQPGVEGAAAVVSVAYLGILGAGAFRYARAILDVPSSHLVAIAAALNGYVLSWGAAEWTPAVASFAFVPWAMWALDRARRAGAVGREVVLASIFVGLVVASGWPFSILMLGLFSAQRALRTVVEARRARDVLPLLLPWVLGAGLAAPAVLTFLEYGSFCARAISPASHRALMLPLPGLPALLVPSYPDYWWFTHLSFRSCPELAAGLAPAVGALIAVIAGGRSFWRERRWDAALLGAVLLLAASPTLGPLRWSFRWLPLFHLLLATLGAEGLAQLRQEADPDRQRPARWLGNPGAVAAVAVLLVWARALQLDAAVQDGASELGRDLFIVSVGWAVAERSLARRPDVRAWVPVLVALVALADTFTRLPTGELTPGWTFRSAPDAAPPLEPDVRYLSVYTYGDVYTETPAWNLQGFKPRGQGSGLLPGDVSLLAGVEGISGYSPMLPRNFHELFSFDSYGDMREPRARDLLRRETASGGLLDLMGVDGLIVADRFSDEIPGVIARGWRTASAVDGGTVLRRTGAPSRRVRAVAVAGVEATDDAVLRRIDGRSPGDPTAPVVLSSSEAGRTGGSAPFAEVRIGSTRTTRLREEIEVSVPAGGPEGLLLFARPYYPGWRARMNGHDLPVEGADLIMPAVRVPAGASGVLSLEYRPASLLAGLAVLGVALAALMALSATAIFGRGRDEGPGASTPPW
jgi:hypothetical protein